jgi:hypothetical protein
MIISEFNYFFLKFFVILFLYFILIKVLLFYQKVFILLSYNFNIEFGVINSLAIIRTNT